jgi:dihydroorotase
MTESTNPEEVVVGYDRPYGEEAWIAMKMFLRAVSNSGGHDVDDVKAIIPCVKAMTHTKWKHKRQPMVLKIHCERKFTTLGRRIPIDDRERIAVERDVEYILREVPEAHIEVCHVSDGDSVEAIRYYQSKGYNVTGEICPHYAEYSNDDLFEDGNGGTGFSSKHFCLPKFKGPLHKRIILDTMLSGEPWWHYGDDGACHHHDPSQPSGVKINNRGIVVGGQTQLPKAVISYVIEKFVDAGRTEHLQGFLVDNARKLYGLEPNDEARIFQESEWAVPMVLEKVLPGKTISCHVAMGGQTRRYVSA